MGRNWIEVATGKELAWRPCCIGVKNGRKLYAVNFEDGTEVAYFIDFEKKTLEEF